jgi:hypothetical protein
MGVGTVRVRSIGTSRVIGVHVCTWTGAEVFEAQKNDGVGEWMFEGPGVGSSRGALTACE